MITRIMLPFVYPTIIWLVVKNRPNNRLVTQPNVPNHYREKTKNIFQTTSQLWLTTTATIKIKKLSPLSELMAMSISELLPSKSWWYVDFVCFLMIDPAGWCREGTREPPVNGGARTGIWEEVDGSYIQEFCTPQPDYDIPILNNYHCDEKNPDEL